MSARKATIPDSHADLLDGRNTSVLTTVGADGHPQSTAVWFLRDDDSIKTSISTNRQKYKNLTRNPKATLFVLDPTNPYRSVEVRATVDLAPDPDKALLPRFADRHNGASRDARPGGTDPVVATLNPVRVVANG